MFLPTQLPNLFFSLLTLQLALEFNSFQLTSHAANTVHLFEATDKSEGKHTMLTNLVHFLRAGLMHKHYWTLVDPLSEVNNLDLM